MKHTTQLTIVLISNPRCRYQLRCDNIHSMYVGAQQLMSLLMQVGSHKMPTHLHSLGLGILACKDSGKALLKFWLTSCGLRGFPVCAVKNMYAWSSKVVISTSLTTPIKAVNKVFSLAGRSKLTGTNDAQRLVFRCWRCRCRTPCLPSAYDKRLPGQFWGLLQLGWGHVPLYHGPVMLRTPVVGTARHDQLLVRASNGAQNIKCRAQALDIHRAQAIVGWSHQ